MEYPRGTFTQMLFGGQASASASGGLFTSDAAKVAIPRGARFWVHIHLSNPAGLALMFNGTNNTYPNDGLEISASALPDTTMSNSTLTNTFTAFGANTSAFMPAAVVAMTQTSAACLIGDSRIRGYADQANDASNNAGEIARVVGPRMAYINMGAPSETGVTAAGSYALRQTLLPYCTVAYDGYGINDLSGASGTAYSVAQAEAARASLDALFSYGRVIGVTIAPYTSSTDNWATAANQSTNSTVEPERLQMNADIRAGLGVELGPVDIDRMLDPNATGKWPTNGTAKAYTPDGTHETSLAAQQLEAWSPLWQTVPVQ